jgi:hypothetical protein
MSEPVEVIVRVVGVDGGPAKTGAPANANEGNGSSSNGSRPTSPFGAQSRPTQSAGRSGRDLPFDPAEAALNRMSRESKARETDAAYRRLRGLPSAEDQAAGDASQRAAERMKREADQAMERNARRQMRDDPENAARARIGREARQRETENTYRRMTGKPSLEKDAATKAMEKTRKEAERAAKAAASRQQKIFGALGRAGRSFGQAGIANAVGSPFGAATEMAGGLSEVGSLAGVGGAVGSVAAIAVPVGIAVGALTAFGVGVKELTNQFVERGRELSGLSPQLAGANARADIREFRSDVREAQVLGPGTARLTDAESQLNTSFREIMLPIKAAITDEIVELLETANEFLEPVADLMKEYGPEIKELIKAGIEPAIEGVKILLEIAKFLGFVAESEKKKQDNTNPALSQLYELAAMSTLPLGQRDNRVNDPLRRAASEVMNVPVFDGAG